MTKENKNFFKLDLQFFADADAENQDIDVNNDGENAETNNANQQNENVQTDKTFTQEEVTRLIQREVAKAKKQTDNNQNNSELETKLNELTQKFEQTQLDIKKANTEKELLANGIDPTKLQYAMLDVQENNIEDIAKYANDSIFKIQQEDNSRAKEVTTQNHTQIKRMVGHNFGKDD